MSGQENLREDPLAEISNETTSPTLATEQLSTRYNMRSPAVKRILREAAEMAQHDKTILFARPLDENIFEWHFTFRGPPDTVYQRGVYHGRLILPSQYPMSPPEVVMITPSGRFETGNRICLSISNYHPETWQPSWSIRTAIMALRSFMATNSPGAIGSIESPDAARNTLAINSSRLECVECGVVGNILEPERPLPPQVPTVNPTLPCPAPTEEQTDIKVEPSSESKPTSDSTSSPVPDVANFTRPQGPLAYPERNENDENVAQDLRGNRSDARASESAQLPLITNYRVRRDPQGELNEERNPENEPRADYENPRNLNRRRQALRNQQEGPLNWAIGFVVVLIGGILIRRAFLYNLFEW